MKLRYVELHPWKYRTVDLYIERTAITGYPAEAAYIVLTDQGVLAISPGYCWDGPSGPAIDTPGFIRASLVHDALYQLMRLRLIPQECKALADQELLRICREDGMGAIRARYVYWAVSMFGAAACEPGTEEERRICEVGHG